MKKKRKVSDVIEHKTKKKKKKKVKKDEEGYSMVGSSEGLYTIGDAYNMFSNWQQNKKKKREGDD